MSLLPLILVTITGAILVYGTVDLPPFGAADNPVHQHIAPHYLIESEDEIGIPNVVTSVLGSYRGYDTMGEVTVVFAAAVGVLLLLARGPKPGTMVSGMHGAGAAKPEEEPEVQDDGGEEAADG